MSSQILIVDDEPFMVRLIESSLKKGGFSLSSCRNGEAALESVSKGAPDLIIMDLMMPGMDGLATVRRMRENPALGQVPVIMLTAKGHQLSQAEAAECGIQLLLTKPFSPRNLLEAAASLLKPGSTTP